MMASSIVFRTRIRLVDFADVVRPHSPMAETEDLKSFQCRFQGLFSSLRAYILSLTTGIFKRFFFNAYTFNTHHGKSC